MGTLWNDELLAEIVKVLKQIRESSDDSKRKLGDILYGLKHEKDDRLASIENRLARLERLVLSLAPEQTATQLRPIEELDISVRAYNCLRRAEVKTIGELIELTPQDLAKLKNTGRRTVDEIIRVLREQGLALRGPNALHGN